MELDLMSTSKIEIQNKMGNLSFKTQLPEKA
jgi:hypothetical protein